MTSNLVLAAQCFFRIVMKWKLSLGAYEWRLHALVLSVVATVIIVGLSIDAFGPGPFFLIFRMDWKTAGGSGAECTYARYIPFTARHCSYCSYNYYVGTPLLRNSPGNSKGFEGRLGIYQGGRPEPQNKSSGRENGERTWKLSLVKVDSGHS